METVPNIGALALFPIGRPSDELGPVVEMIASWSDSFSQRALLIGASGCHAILLLGSDSQRMSSRILLAFTFRLAASCFDVRRG